MRSHRAQLDQMLTMLDEATPVVETVREKPTVSESVAPAALPQPQQQLQVVPAAADDIEVSYSGTSDSEEQGEEEAKARAAEAQETASALRLEARVSEALDLVYAEFSDETEQQNDEVVSILDVKE